MPVIKYKNRCIKLNNKAADVHNIYELTLEQTNGGTISANKLTGYYGNPVSLYNTPSSNYIFGNYNITGATLTGNEFNFNTNNVTANATTPMSGFDGDVVTLTNEVTAAHYFFNGYSALGAELSGDKFAFNGSDVSARFLFNKEPTRNVNLIQTIGGTITATPMTGYDGDTVVLTNTPESGYDFISYELTGSTLYNNNKFDFNGNNVSVKPKFQVKPLTSGWTIRTTGTSRVVATMDPALGESKTIYETVRQLNGDLSPMAGGFVSSFLGSNVFGNDQYAAFAPSAGIYNSVWTNASDYSDNTGELFCNFGASNTANITDIYTMDFFNQRKDIWNLGYFKATSSLPQKAEYILNAKRVKGLYGTFSGFNKVKTPVIPFIKACLSAMTNLNTIQRPLQGSCTASPDYQEALTLYPNWF